VGGERMPVGDKKEALILLLQFYPILEDAMIVAEMEAPCGAHSREHAFVLSRKIHHKALIRSKGDVTTISSGYNTRLHHPILILLFISFTD
jgi:hypothetical protein